MNKKLFLAVGATVCIVAALFAILLTRRPIVDAYAQVIPQDAKALARIDLRQLVGEANLSAADELRLLSRVLFVSENKATGLDMARPVYAFVTKVGDIGIAARVDDDSQLRERLNELNSDGKATPAVRQRDLTWTVIDGQWLMAFDDDKALVMGPAIGSAQDYLRNLMAGLMQQRREDSGMSSQLYIELNQRQAPMAAVVAADIMPKSVQSNIRSYANLPALDTLHLGMELHTHDNAIDLSVDMLTDDTQMRKAIDAIGQWLRPIDGSLIDKCPTDAALWLCTNIDGSRLLTALRDVQELRVMLVMVNTVANVDAIIKAIDGDVAVQVGATDASRAGASTPALLTAQLRDTDFLAEASYWLQKATQTGMFALSSTAPNEFRLTTGDTSLLFGTAGNTLYVSNSPELKPIGDGRSDATDSFLAHRVPDIRGNRLYATFTPQAMPAELHGWVEAAGLPINDIERVELAMPSTDRLTLHITAREGMNIARSLLLNE